MENAKLSPLAPFIGEWEGQGAGQPGASQVTISFGYTLNGTFVENYTRAQFPPTEKHPAGELHEDRGLFSYDRSRKVIVLRQFHVEGFVNQYVLTHLSEDGQELVFETEAIENIPPGFRARTTYRIEGPDAFRQVFELAPPGADYTVYSQNSFRRQGNT
jgi:hypothetical protein